MAILGAFMFHKHILFQHKAIFYINTTRSCRVNRMDPCQHPSVPKSTWIPVQLCLTHSHTMTLFDDPWETSLLKTLWEKEKLLVMSNFSFSHSVFYLFGELSSIFVKFEIVVCKLFQF